MGKLKRNTKVCWGCNKEPATMQNGLCKTCYAKPCWCQRREEDGSRYKYDAPVHRCSEPCRCPIADLKRSERGKI